MKIKCMIIQFCGLSRSGTKNCILPSAVHTNSTYSFIGGGQNNKLSGCYSAILGGQNNTVSHNHAAVFGNGINSVCNNAFHVDCLIACGTPSAYAAPTGAVMWKACSALLPTDRVLVIAP